MNSQRQTLSYLKDLFARRAMAPRHQYGQNFLIDLNIHELIARTAEIEPNDVILEVGPGTGPVTEALVERGVDPARLVLVEFNPVFCRLLRSRYPEATVVQGDAYSLKRLLETLLKEPAAAVVSGLPLLTKPVKTRLRLINDAFALLRPEAPFIQFTYSMTTPPIPKGLARVETEASDRIWLNLPPARVWVYRRA